MIRLDVPISRPAGPGIRSIHLVQVAVGQAERASIVPVAQDVRHGISYLAHEGTLFRSLTRLRFRGGQLQMPDATPLTATDLRRTAEDIGAAMGKDALSSWSAPDFLHVHRMFTDLRSLRANYIPIRDWSFPTHQEATIEERASAQQVADSLLVVDDEILIRTHGPEGRIHHDGKGRPILFVPHPDAVDASLPTTPVFPAHLQLMKVDGQSVQHQAPQDIVVHREDLLAPTAMAAMETERTAWAVLGRLHDCSPSWMSRSELQGYSRLRREMSHRSQGEIAGRGPRSMHRLDFPPPGDLDPLLRGLRDLHARTLPLRSSIDALNRLVWFDIVAWHSAPDTDALADLLVA